MRKMSLFKSFILLSLCTFIITGLALVMFINNHLKNDMIDSENKSVHLTLRYILESDLDTADLNGIIEGAKKDKIDSSFMHLIEMDISIKIVINP